MWPVCEQQLDTRYLHRLFRYVPRDNHRESIPIGRLSSVSQAEETAVLRCTELLLPKNVKRRRIRICSDSRVAIAALAITTTESALVWDSMQALEKPSGSNKVTLVRIPGRHEVTGKEEADKLVKRRD